MTKAEWLAELKRTGEYDRQSCTKLWGDVFKAYTGETKDTVNCRCGSCYTKVKKWLLN